MMLYLEQTKPNISLEFYLHNLQPGDHYNILLDMEGTASTTLF